MRLWRYVLVSMLAEILRTIKSLMHQRHGLNAPLALLEQAADSFVRNRISLEA